MLQVFDYFDYLGLERHIVNVAKRESQRPGAIQRSYQLIVTDFEKDTNYVYQLLHLLPPAVIRSLIRNTLPFDKINDPEVKRFYESEMRVEDPCAGVYVQWVANAPGAPVNPARAMVEGRFLTSEQVSQMLNLVQGYLENEPSSVNNNNTIDKTYDPLFLPNSSGTRAISMQGDTAPKVREWIANVRNQYCTGIDTAKEKDAFLRTPMEVGWVQDFPSRIDDPVHAAQTSPLLCVVNAIARKFFDLPNKEHALLFPVPFSEDPNFYSTAEVLGSILCSSDYTFGGLNIDPAVDSSRAASDMDDDVLEASTRYFNGRLQLGHVTDEVERHQKQDELLKAAQKLPASRQELAAAIADYEGKKKELDTKAEEYRTLLETSPQQQLEASQAEREQAVIEGADTIPQSPAPLTESSRLVQKRQIWSILGAYINAEDDEVAKQISGGFRSFDQDLFAEAMQEYKEADARGRKEADDELERRRREAEEEGQG